MRVRRLWESARRPALNSRFITIRRTTVAPRSIEDFGAESETLAAHKIDSPQGTLRLSSRERFPIGFETENMTRKRVVRSSHIVPTQRARPTARTPGKVRRRPRRLRTPATPISFSPRITLTTNGAARRLVSGTPPTWGCTTPISRTSTASSSSSPSTGRP
jgi:hypothetical protein